MCYVDLFVANFSIQFSDFKSWIWDFLFHFKTLFTHFRVFEVVKNEIEKEQEQQETVEEAKPEIKKWSELKDNGVTLDPAEVDLEQVIEKADEKTLNNSPEIIYLINKMRVRRFLLENEEKYKFGIKPEEFCS